MENNIIQVNKLRDGSYNICIPKSFTDIDDIITEIKSFCIPYCDMYVTETEENINIKHMSINDSEEEEMINLINEYNNI